jgi:hypothetical protein
MCTPTWSAASPEVRERMNCNFAWFMDWMTDRFGQEPRESQSPYLCWTKLVRGKSCPSARGRGQGHSCQSPNADHVARWMVGGKTVALTSEPYCRIDDWSEGSILDEEQRWAEEQGLHMQVFDKSWWCPHLGPVGFGTVLIVFTASDPKEIATPATEQSGRGA